MLYERVRDDIGENGKLNYHLYAALKKALFKPQPWIKAILLPLARDNCTLREAVIIGSVVAKVGRLGRFVFVRSVLSIAVVVPACARARMTP